MSVCILRDVGTMKQTTEHTEYTEEENLTKYRRFAAYGISRKESVYGCQRYQLPWYFRVFRKRSGILCFFFFRVFCVFRGSPHPASSSLNRKPL